MSSRDLLLTRNGATGIYVFSKPKSQWNIQLEDNNSDIWYIGKSDGNTLRGRVWKHLDPVNSDKRELVVDGKPFTALFSASEWDIRNNVDQNIKDSIVSGKFVVYSIYLKS